MTIKKKVNNASQASELAMGFVRKMVPTSKAKEALLVSAKRTNSLWEVKIGVLGDELLLKINDQGEIEEYTTSKGPSPI
ncbi:MAG TPA: hypothetical protein ACFYD3_03660 [Candidatus Hypogeohydataceae bacterium YC41]